MHTKPRVSLWWLATLPLAVPLAIVLQIWEKGFEILERIRRRL
jgi:hypothetical protein